jgi:hypothetical protein
VGKRQPYTAYMNRINNTINPGLSQVVFQTNGASAAAGQPQNTFWSHNSPLQTPFDWLVHLDRPPVNVLELLHVSGFKPHELTQQFVKDGGKNFHYPMWNPFQVTSPLVQQSMLYRVLDMLGTPNHLVGTFRGGRWPGNINLNTIMDPKVFVALCDSQEGIQLGPLFKRGQVWTPPGQFGHQQSIYYKLISSRNPNGDPLMALALSPNPKPMSEGRPYKPFAAGLMDDSFFRGDPNGVPFFTLGYNWAGDHPYLKSALLQKIYNNITTTSNVFAVWWTVGYFEVTDESVRPPRLGSEIGRAENRHIRHRFFAVVDRTGLQLFNTLSTAKITLDTTKPTPQTFTLGFNAIPNAPNGQPITMQPGMLLEVGTGNTTEVVVVKSVAGNSFTADFTQNHAAKVPIICRGNPGPQMNYNPHKDSSVILHVGVIK